MAHVDLKPYPFPQGGQVPRLMPFQEYPWNGDGYLAAEVLRLKDAHGLCHAIETGTCLGSTAIWLSENIHGVVTFEINPQFFEIAHARIEMSGANVTSELFDSVDGINGIPMFGMPILFWLDAHWGSHCPLLDELDAIAAAGVKPCIIIHDFHVPGTDFGFDKMPDGRPFNLELIRPHIDAIYGEGGWKHNYPTKVEGAKRGWVSIEPLSAPVSKD
jgi:hypothetical protein